MMFFSVVAALCFLFFVSFYSYDSKTAFVNSSQSRLESGLGALFTTVSCSSEPVSKIEWKIYCTEDFGNNKFKYLDRSAEREKHYKGAYYYVALNKNAVQIAETGLLSSTS